MHIYFPMFCLKVWVRAYEDRMDLLSIMIAGPAKTPYEDGLFMFDVQLGGEYPRAPPLCHYISYCSDRLNPNLYEDGKVGGIVFLFNVVFYA